MVPQVLQNFYKRPIESKIWSHKYLALSILSRGTGIVQSAWIFCRSVKHLWSTRCLTHIITIREYTARRAAEALFAPKKEPPPREPERVAAHKPRILAVQPPARSDAANTPLR